MKPREDLTGKVFGDLTVVEFNGSKIGEVYRYSWACVCACGGVASVLTGHLRSGAIQNCGCKKRTRGGKSSDPLYAVWANMLRRCTDYRDKAYKDYGGRGVQVSPSWLDFCTFMSDMGPRPVGFTLERLNNSEGYCRTNCVWADRATQANNKRNVALLEYLGEFKSVTQWARLSGLHPETLRSRLKAGRQLSEALSPFYWHPLHETKGRPLKSTTT